MSGLGIEMNIKSFFNMAKTNQKDKVNKNKEQETNNSTKKETEQVDNTTNNKEESQNQQQTEEKQEADDTSSSENLNDEANPQQNNEQAEQSEEEKLKDQLQEQKDKYKRLVAEFENYKKRTSKERLDLFKSANREVMQALLPVVDDFDRAVKEIEKQDDNQFEGIKLIHNKLNDTLKSQGLTTINVKEGDKFDADIHEAVTQVPAPKEELKGKIVDIVEKGYSLGEKILRFPKVVTGK